MRSPADAEEAVQLLEGVKLEGLSDSHPLDTLMLLGQAEERIGRLEEAGHAFQRAVDMYDVLDDDQKAKLCVSLSNTFIFL